jgi:hypothetical protein
MFDQRLRLAAVNWHHKHGRNVSATSRQFGIARSTLYRWLEMFNPEHPRSSLRSRWTQHREPRPRPKEARFYGHFLRLQVTYPRWGRRRLWRELSALGPDAPSEATIGRWLRDCLEKCPVCGGRQGRHETVLHKFREDFKHYLPRPKPRRGTRRPSDKRVALQQAEKMLREARKRRSRLDADHS